MNAVTACNWSQYRNQLLALQVWGNTYTTKLRTQIHYTGHKVLNTIHPRITFPRKPPEEVSVNTKVTTLPTIPAD